MYRTEKRNKQVHDDSWGLFKNPSATTRTTREKINKDIEDLNNPITQQVLFEMYKILHSKTAKYTYFSPKRPYPRP